MNKTILVAETHTSPLIPGASPLLLFFFFVSRLSQRSSCTIVTISVAPVTSAAGAAGSSGSKSPNTSCGLSRERPPEVEWEKLMEKRLRRADGDTEFERRTAMTHPWRWQLMRWDREAWRRQSHVLSWWDTTTGWVTCVLTGKEGIRDMMMITRKVRTLLGSEADPHKFNGLFEG